MHMPVIPRREFKGQTGQGDWADSLLELDADFGVNREPPLPPGAPLDFVPPPAPEAPDG